EEYLAVLKGVLDTVKATISEVADEVGAKSEKERRAFMHGVRIGSKAAGSEQSRSVLLRNGWGDFDWKEIRKTYLTLPQPSLEDKEATFKLLKTTPHVIRRALLKTAKKLSHAPGGHPRAFSTKDEELAACKRIEAYRIDEHLDTAEAIERVALELNSM